MGRTEKRRQEKRLKSKLTDAQYQDLKEEAFKEQLNVEMDRFIGNFIVVFKATMKENRISQERSERIIMEMFARTKQNYENGDVGESRQNDAYVEADAFEKVAAQVIEANREIPPMDLAKLLYAEIMKVGGAS